jgi:hypothetical protein
MTASIVCSYLSKHDSCWSKRPQAINFRHAQNLDMVAESDALVHDVQLYFILSSEALSQSKI